MIYSKQFHRKPMHVRVCVAGVVGRGINRPVQYVC